MISSTLVNISTRSVCYDCVEGALGPSAQVVCAGVLSALIDFRPLIYHSWFDITPTFRPNNLDMVINDCELVAGHDIYTS